MATYIVISEEVFLTNTDEEISAARAALRGAEMEEAPEYVGDPDDPSSYKGSNVLFADPRPSRSGAKWSEAQYAAKGYGRLSLRLSADTLEKLAAKAEADGCSRAEVVDVAIREYVKKR